MLRLKLLRSFILSSSPFKYISSCIKCSRWHPGTERNWSLLDRSLQEKLRGAVQVPPALLTPLGAAPGTCGPWAGQEGQGDIYRWAGKSQVGFLDLFYCERVSHSLFSTLSSSVASFIALQLLEGRISCFVLFLYSVSLILVCPFVF